MPRFSANLGFLWTDLALPDAIGAAAKAGFDAVECHWPFETDPAQVNDALKDAGIPMLGLNTSPGCLDANEFGLAALPDRQAEARAAIDQALSYANQVGAKAVHVMAGIAEGEEAMAAFEANLRYACARAKGKLILIEPLNVHDVPGYFLSDLAQAKRVIDQIKAPNLKVMFDCYHAARSGEDVCAKLEQMLPVIGHIQFAGVPDRGAPDFSTLDYDQVFRHLDALNWRHPLGAEYRPTGKTEASLGWLGRFQ